MTASAAAPPGDLPRLIADIRSGLDDTADLINSVIHGITSVLSELPRHVVGPVLDEVAKLRGLFDATVAMLVRALDYAGDPDALRAAGAAWATDIGGSVSRLCGLASDITVQADDHWTGKAADAYHNTLLPQRFALAEVKTAGDEIDTVLNAFANSIIDFWVPVSNALISLAAGLITAAFAAKSGIGAPLAAATAAGLVTFVATFVGTQIASFFGLFNNANTLETELRGRLSNDTTYPGGAWPASTTDISDGSITDGDDTDWHIT